MPSDAFLFFFAFDALRAADVREAVAGIEGLGYPSVWVPEGGSSREIFAHLSLLADAGLIAGDKRGRWVWYRVVPERVDLLRSVLA